MYGRISVSKSFFVRTLLLDSVLKNLDGDFFVAHWTALLLHLV